MNQNPQQNNDPTPNDNQGIMVRLGDHVIRYEKGQWVPGDNDQRTLVLASMARAITTTYQYSPSHGQPGYQLAHMVADAIGGKAVLPPVPPAKPGVVY